MITLTGLTPRQRMVAEIIWRTEDVREVERFCSLDRDARTVHDLIIAAEMDRVVANSSLDEARAVLDQFRI
jgi:hypothetical protein